jgi:HD-like signal output (HDOD) protein
MKPWWSRLFGGAPSPSTPSAHTPASVPAATPAAAGIPDVDGLFYPWLLGIDAAGNIELNEAEKRYLRALERLESADGAEVAELVPRMPAVIPMLLQSLRDKNVSNAQLSEQISQDAVLVAAVLRQVNSSWYRRTTTIISIEQALTMLGQNGLRLLVASVAFKPVITTQSGYFTKLAAPHIAELSAKCALACRRLALQKHIDPFEPFLAALTQYAGLLAALRAVDHVHDGTDTLRSSSFCVLLARHAQLLARRVGEQWNFPCAVIDAVGGNDRAGVRSAVGEVLHRGDWLSKIRVLVDSGRLRDADAEQWLTDDELRACYQELAPAGACE